jgi:nitrate/nitrite-specific signal transduction histidine kinase
MTQDLNAALGWIILRILGLNAALAAALVLVLRRQVIRPLGRLEAYAARVSSGRNVPPLAEYGPLRGELRSLGLAMEAMVHQLSAAQRKYRVFSKTPPRAFSRPPWTAVSWRPTWPWPRCSATKPRNSS